MNLLPPPAGDLSQPPRADESDLIRRLRAGDESAFTWLVEQYHASMLRVAGLYVDDLAAAEDVAQEAWIGVLHGLERFEARSSLKTWIFTILTNRAKTRAQRERRYLPLAELQAEGEGPAVAPDRFRRADDPWQGAWADGAKPAAWDEIPEDRLLSAETQAVITRAIEALPAGQRAVIRLRDIEGWSSDEVCNVLAISETNQRVLLHRARSRVRQALEQYLAG